jgi:hypothetical protein
MRRLLALTPLLPLLLWPPLPARADAQVDAAIRALRKDASLKVRTQAAIVLGQRGAGEAVPALREAVAEDEAPSVRLAAVGALAKLGVRSARATLKAAAETDPDGAVRGAATRALEGFGPVTLQVEEPGGTASARAAVRESLTRHLRERGLAVAEVGELRLRPTATVGAAAEGGKTVIQVKVSLVVVDGDGHLEMLESSARTAVAGAPSEAKLAGYSLKVVDAALKGLSEDLAGRLGRR